MCDEFFTVPEVAERLRVNRHKVLRWIAGGELAAADVSQSRGQRPRYRIAAEDFQRFVESRLINAAAAVPPRKHAKRAKVREFIS